MAVIPAPDRPTHELGETRFTSLATPSRGSTDTSVWQVEISPGTPATPHRLTREEVFVLLAGRADVRIGGQRSHRGDRGRHRRPARRGLRDQPGRRRGTAGALLPPGRRSGPVRRGEPLHAAMGAVTPRQPLARLFAIGYR